MMLEPHRLEVMMECVWDRATGLVFFKARLAILMFREGCEPQLAWLSLRRPYVWPVSLTEGHILCIVDHLLQITDD